MNKKVIFLVGPKGSGKTHIGSTVARCTDIPFLRVEPLWLGLARNQDGWSIIERHVDDILKANDCVILESLGGSEGFNRLRASLTSKYSVFYIKIVASLETCLTRVLTRGKDNHINISDGKVQEYNLLASKVELPWLFEISNEPFISKEKLLDMFHDIQLLH